MNDVENIYYETICRYCSKVSMEHLPSVSASELIYRVVTLEDIYLPLNLGNEQTNAIDINELIRRIDEKLAMLNAILNNKDVVDDFSAVEDRDSALNFDSQQTETNFTIDASLDQLYENVVNYSDDGDKVVENSTGNIDYNNSNSSDSPCVALQNDMCIIKARAGAGKTTFCKKLVLAIVEQESSFFEKYLKDNKLSIKQNSLPLFIKCNAVEEFTLEEIRKNDIEDLFYKLLKVELGETLSEIQQYDFTKLIKEKCHTGMTLILDGWDEIFNQEKEITFVEKIRLFLSNNSKVDLVITIRENYEEPKFLYNAKRYFIQPLTDSDIQEFCRRWCSVLLSPNDKMNYLKISSQILSSKNQQVLLMMKNPFDLSLLLITARDEGRLPENKAVLFDRIIDMYVHWSYQKGTCIISEKTTKMFLAYIACAFTKYNVISCDAPKLRLIIGQCITDLYWRIKEELSDDKIDEIIKELLHTGLLSQSSDRKYSFSNGENSSSQHRQIQEYLTAYAIYHRYTDDEYKNQIYTEIFENKYLDLKWHEVIIFFVLIGEGYIPQCIVNQIIDKAENHDENSYYTNLLFSFVINGADIDNLGDRHRIYDVIFKEHITDKQITNITLMLATPSKFTEDFKEYIHNKFVDSVSKGNAKYGYANAIIEATIARLQGISPFDHVIELMSDEDNKPNVIAGSQMLLLLAWCKYERINNIFAQFFLNYKMPAILKCTIRQHIKVLEYKLHIFKAIKDIILAGYAEFYDLLDERDIEYCCNYLNDKKDLMKDKDDSEIRTCEEILSMVPIFNNFTIKDRGSVGIKETYHQRFQDNLVEKNMDDLIFTFNICTVLGCWSEFELSSIWKEVDAVYSTAMKNNDVIKLNNACKTRYNQLKEYISEYVGDLDIYNAINNNRFGGVSSRYDEGNGILNDSVSKRELESTGDAITFKVINDEGLEVECEVLFTFESQETGKNYIVYTDNTLDEEGNTRVFASVYNPDEAETNLMPIETEREWQIIQTILEEIQNVHRSVKNGQ